MTCNYSCFSGFYSSTAADSWTTVPRTQSTYTACDYFSSYQTESTTPSWYHSHQSTTSTGYPYTYEHCNDKRETEEQQKKRIEEENKIRKLAEQRKEEADKKARDLLLEYLSEENKARLSQNKAIEVQSNLFSDIRYRIPSSHGRIMAMKNSEDDIPQCITEMCIAVQEFGLPKDDVILTKLLYLKYDEERAILTANHSGIKENLIDKLNRLDN